MHKRLKTSIISLSRNHLIILLAIVSYIYFQTINFGFENLDTRSYLDELKKLNNITDYFSFINAVFSGDTISLWQPITILSLYLDYSIDGENPSVFHSTNIIFHLINTYLVYVIIKKVLNDKKKSFFIAAIFAAHPINVETVVWIAERKGLLAAFFTLLSIYAYTLYIEKKHTLKLVASVLFYTLSLLSKPTLITCVFLYFSIDIIKNKHPLNLSGSIKSLSEKWPYILIGMVVGFISLNSHFSTDAMLYTLNVSNSIRIETILHNLFTHISHFYIPINLTLFYPISNLSTPLALFYSSILILLLILIFSSRFKNKNIKFGIAWFVIFFIPTSGIISSGIQTIADRYSYIPAIGLAIITVEIIYFLTKNFKNNEKIIYFVMFFYIATIMFASVSQVKTWSKDIIYWSRNYTISKDNFYTSYAFSQLLYEYGKKEEAIAVFSNTIKKSNDTYYYFFGLSKFTNLLINKKDYANAKLIITIALEKNYKTPSIYKNYAFLEHYHFHNTHKAINILKESAQEFPGNIESYVLLSEIYMETNKINKAAKTLHLGLKENPESNEIKEKIKNLNN